MAAYSWHWQRSKTGNWCPKTKVSHRGTQAQRKAISTSSIHRSRLLVPLCLCASVRDLDALWKRPLVFVILLVWCCGCSEGAKPYKTAPVSGVITLDGEPLASAHVTLLPVHEG